MIKNLDDYFLVKEELDPYFDSKYPEIKQGIKFTPKERTQEYSVYIIKDAHAENNEVLVEEIVYSWCGGYYIRTNKDPFWTYINRDELLKSHRVAYKRIK